MVAERARSISVPARLCLTLACFVLVHLLSVCFQRPRTESRNSVVLKGRTGQLPRQDCLTPTTSPTQLHAETLCLL